MQQTEVGYLLLLAIVLAVVFGVRLKQKEPIRRMGRGFGGSKPVYEASKTTFQDVAANGEALRSLSMLVDYLKNPEKYGKMGARMPRGVLLYGPPGTGKTLLAQALAGEAGVPFFALSGSDFVQMYVGVGASRVRELFQKAKKAGKCVIFIDEIDAMGKRRDDSASEEREQTLNALLSEMSGFKKNSGSIVLAATNRLDTLDPALLRPGRFDRKIEVGLPGFSERLDILKLHSRGKPLAEGVDLGNIAAQTVYFSGASLEALLNEAAIRAAQRGSGEIERGDIDAAFLATVAGEDKPSHAAQKEKATIALHEAGHALATRLLLPDQRVTRISILPSGKGAAGYSLSIPPELAIIGRDRLARQIQVLLAGRAAELLIGGPDEITGGASNDLSRAAEIASAMALDLGMTGEPGVALRPLKNACGTGDALDRCKDLLNRQFDAVTSLLQDNSELLMKLTEALIHEETIDENRFMELVA
jgi:cell division protease FtsH